MKDKKKRPLEIIDVDNRTSEEVVEDVAFENRIRKLIRKRKWKELEANFLLYGSALEARYAEE